MKKQILSFVLVLCLISTLVSGISITASASSSGTCGENLTWTLDDEGTFTISGTGDMTDFLSDSDVPWYRLTWEIKTVVIKDGVTSIGDGAFSSCSNLTSITIPENVTIIGDGAFERCYRLETVTIGNKVISIGDSAFEFCNSLNSIIIPDSVTSIGSRAFYGCRSLASIIIPDGVTSIGRYSFSGCGSLAFVKIGKGVTSVGEWLHDDIDNFDGCDSLVSIEVSEDNLNYSSQDGVLFDKGKKKLLVYPSGNERTAYTIPDSVTSIGDRAFENCKNLASVTIGNGVTSIDEGTFNSCDNLAYIAIGSGVTDIYDNIFSEFANLETIKVSENNPYFSSQDGVLFDKDKKTILIYPRGNKRTTYTIPNSVTSIGDEEYGYSSDYSVFYHCSNLSRVTIPDSVTRIGGWAFLDCTDLASVTIGSGVTYIGPYAFGGCSSLTTIEVSENNPNYSSQDGVLFDKGKKKLLVYPSGNERTEYTIPDSVTSVGSSAFSDCGHLANIVIPESVTSIGYASFYNCANLTSITIPASVKNIDGYAFYNCNKLKDVYYEGSEENWNKISIEEDGNEDLLNATIHYNYKPYTTTSVSVKDGQKTFTISPNGIKLNDAVILALYKGGVFIGLQNAIYNGEDIIFKTDKDYDKAKIMVWGSLTDLKPVTNAEVK